MEFGDVHTHANGDISAKWLDLLVTITGGSVKVSSPYPNEEWIRSNVPRAKPSFAEWHGKAASSVMFMRNHAINVSMRIDSLDMSIQSQIMYLLSLFLELWSLKYPHKVLRVIFAQPRTQAGTIFKTILPTLLRFV